MSMRFGRTIQRKSTKRKRSANSFYYKVVKSVILAKFILPGRQNCWTHSTSSQNRKKCCCMHSNRKFTSKICHTLVITILVFELTVAIPWTHRAEYLWYQLSSTTLSSFTELHLCQQDKMERPYISKRIQAWIIAEQIEVVQVHPRLNAIPRVYCPSSSPIIALFLINLLKKWEQLH